MQNLKILNTRQRKGILELLKQQYKSDFKKKASELVILQSSKNKIYLLSRDFAKVDDKKLRIDSAGLYFGEIMKNDELRLSIEGSQLIGPIAKKNVVELDDEETRLWLRGDDIEKELKTKGFVILKSRNKETGRYDFVGCGKYKAEEKKILNYVPKTRRVLG